MALGGGTWVTQNKTLPGTYENFVSIPNASATLSDRGIASVPMELNWGADGMIELELEDFQKHSLNILGYSYNADEMKPLRELFENAVKVFLYRLNGKGAKASNTYATAKYAGTRGNNIKVGITPNVDDPTKWDVTTYVETTAVDIQTVAAATSLVANDFVVWKDGITLSEQAPLALAGGTNSTVTGADHQAYLDAAESYAFNIMAVETTDNTTKRLYASYQKRMRNDVGKKFQLVLYRYAADDIGVISVKNMVTDGKTTGTTYTSAGVYSVTIDGTLAADDVITVQGVSTTLDATSSASVTAAAEAVVANLGTMAEYAVTSSAGVITFTEKADYYGAGAPTASITSDAGTVDVATVTAPGESEGDVYPNEAKLVYFIAGLQAGCAVSASCQNRRYTGEYTVDTPYTQTQLTAALKAGEFVLHAVNGDVRVLDDINTFVSVTDTQGDAFKDNQCIRVIDQLANDDAVIFSTQYLGVVPNDDAGRISLWSDLVQLRRELLRNRAIENFTDDDLKCMKGDDKKSVLVIEEIQPVAAMSKLYVNTTVA